MAYDELTFDQIRLDFCSVDLSNVRGIANVRNVKKSTRTFLLWMSRGSLYGYLSRRLLSPQSVKWRRLLIRPFHGLLLTLLEVWGGGGEGFSSLPQRRIAESTTVITQLSSSYLFDFPHHSSIGGRCIVMRGPVIIPGVSDFRNSCYHLSETGSYLHWKCQCGIGWGDWIITYTCMFFEVCFIFFITVPPPPPPH